MGGGGSGSLLGQMRSEAAGWGFLGLLKLLMHLAMQRLLQETCGVNNREPVGRGGMFGAVTAQ